MTKVLPLLRFLSILVYESKIFSHNKLTTVPAEIGELSSLCSLTLTNNQISSIPDEITRCASLTQFDISHNSLSHLPANIGHLTELKKLSVKYNRLSCLPDSLESCTKIEYLNIENNTIESISQSIFDRLVSVRIAILSRNKFTQLPKMNKMTDLDSFSGRLKVL